MPLENGELDRRVRRAMLDPTKKENVVRLVMLSAVCSTLPDELLMKLLQAVAVDEDVPPLEVLEAVDDRYQVIVLCESMLTRQGRVEVFEAIDLEQHDRAHPYVEGE